ncbi:tail assembly protein [Cupriavidus metallidurans]|uniref:tail assembly protein n=1 Tax=Cupriavidus metallidurans TaxID=119219 RepID=UPI001CCF9158|nr:tail assembly protein [Cupriavidus metallidurans]UBM12751.1 tail assembly protein [Cupriavidus metallidurans]
MREIRLYGHLGKRFGRVHNIEVSSPAEAIRALRANFPAFENYLIRHSKPGYHVFVDKKNLGTDDLVHDRPGDVIKIVPVIAGAGRGLLQIVLGAALIAGAFWTGGATLGGVGGLFTVTSTMGGIALSLGAGLVFGGIAQLLTKPPKAASLESAASTPSYAFNGPVNTTQQGNAVPICYGELIVGSQVVHAGISTDEIPVDWNAAPENPTTGSTGIA